MNKHFFLFAFIWLAAGISACEQEQATNNAQNKALSSQIKDVSPIGAQQPAVADVKQPASQSIQSPQKLVDGSHLYATCVGCHGASGEGGVGPKLAGQSAQALAEKLKGYKAGKTFGAMTAMMASNAQQLSDLEIDVVSAYITQF